MVDPGKHYGPLPVGSAASLLEGAVDAHLASRGEVLISTTPSRPNVLWLPVSREILLRVEQDYKNQGWRTTWEGGVLRIFDPARSQ